MAEVSPVTPDPDREIAGEVTRVEWVEYLQGATGNGVGSLGFLVLGGLAFYITGRAVFGFGALIGSSLLSANGLSLYAWDRVRTYVESGAEDDAATESTRELSPHTLSTVHRAELVGGLVQVAGLVTILVVTVEVFRRTGFRTGAYLLASVLVVGNVCALLLARRSTAE